MKNYVVRFKPVESERVLEIVREFSNDILINHVLEDEIGITIELEDDASDKLYNDLQKEITSRMYMPNL